MYQTIFQTCSKVYGKVYLWQILACPGSWLSTASTRGALSSVVNAFVCQTGYVWDEYLKNKKTQSIWLDCLNEILSKRRKHDVVKRAKSDLPLSNVLFPRWNTFTISGNERRKQYDKRERNKGKYFVFNEAFEYKTSIHLDHHYDARRSTGEMSSTFVDQSCSVHRFSHC